MSTNIKRIAIIGAGTMGSDLALLFALYKFDVILYDISQNVLDALANKHKITMIQLQRHDITKENYENVKNRITLTTELNDIKDVKFILEAIDEDLEKKRNLFRFLGTEHPDSILATNTSSLRVTDIAEGLEAPGRFALMHFSNPSITGGLAEIMKGSKTNENTLKIISQIAVEIGKTPVILTKDMNGAVMNRILATINNEGLWALQNGEVSKEEIDAVFYRTINFNLGLTGVLDLIGLDVALDVGVNLAKSYGKRFGPPIRLLVNEVKKGKLGRKTGMGFNDWSNGYPHADNQLLSTYDDNRIYAIATNEAFWIIKDNLANAEKIDTIIKLGFMMQTGICEIADSIGLNNLYKILKELYNKYQLELYKPCPLFDEYIEKGWIGKDSGRGFYIYSVQY